MKHNTFGKGSKQRAINGGHDEYYTDPNYALHCCEVIKNKFYRFKIDTIIEPSAGNGSFSEGIKLLSKNRVVRMYDINHRKSYITKLDFFKVKDVKNVLKNIDFTNEVNATAGVRSLSKREIHKALYNYYNK